MRQAEFFCSFGSFFALLTTPNDPENQNFEKKRKKKKMPADIILLYIHVYHKWRSYDIWFLKYKVQQTETFIILGHFLSFLPPDNLEHQNFKIEENTRRYDLFTHLHYKWDNYMMYDSWDMEHNRQNFLLSWTVFSSFNPLWT